MATPNLGHHDYKCSVCNDWFNQPKLLVCGHDLCRECLVKWLHSDDLCPLCRSPLASSPEKTAKSFEDIADNLPDNLVMATWVECAKTLSRKPECRFHSGITAMSFCHQGHGMLCSLCTEVHGKFEDLRNHKVEYVTSLTPQTLAASQKALCSSHADRTAEIFCTTHSILLCHECAESKHSQCPEVAKIDRKNEAVREELSQLLDTLDASEQMLTNAIDAMNHRVTEIDTKTESAKDMLEETCERLKGLVESCLHYYKTHVQKFGVQQKDKIFSSLKKLNSLRRRIFSHKVAVNRVQEAVPGSDLFLMTNILSKRVNDLDRDSRVEADIETVSVATKTVEYDAKKRLEQNLILLLEQFLQGELQEYDINFMTSEERVISNVTKTSPHPSLYGKQGFKDNNVTPICTTSNGNINVTPAVVAASSENGHPSSDSGPQSLQNSVVTPSSVVPSSENGYPNFISGLQSIQEIEVKPARTADSGEISPLHFVSCPHCLKDLEDTPVVTAASSEHRQYRSVSGWQSRKDIEDTTQINAESTESNTLQFVSELQNLNNIENTTSIPPPSTDFSYPNSFSGMHSLRDTLFTPTVTAASSENSLHDSVSRIQKVNASKDSPVKPSSSKEKHRTEDKKTRGNSRSTLEKSEFVDIGLSVYKALLTLKGSNYFRGYSIGNDSQDPVRVCASSSSALEALKDQINMLRIKNVSVTHDEMAWLSKTFDPQTERLEAFMALLPETHVVTLYALDMETLTQAIRLINRTRARLKIPMPRKKNVF